MFIAPRSTDTVHWQVFIGNDLYSLPVSLKIRRFLEIFIMHLPQSVAINISIINTKCM